MKIKKWKNSRRHPPTCSTLFRSKVHGNFFRGRENCLKERCRLFRLATFSREEERERGRERTASIPRTGPGNERGSSMRDGYREKPTFSLAGSCTITCLAAGSPGGLLASGCATDEFQPQTLRYSV